MMYTMEHDVLLSTLMLFKVEYLYNGITRMNFFSADVLTPLFYIGVLMQLIYICELLIYSTISDDSCSSYRILLCSRLFTFFIRFVQLLLCICTYARMRVRTFAIRFFCPYFI